MIVFTLLKIWLQHQKKITFSMGHIVIVQKFSGTHFIFLSRLRVFVMTGEEMETEIKE